MSSTQIFTFNYLLVSIKSAIVPRSEIDFDIKTDSVEFCCKRHSVPNVCAKTLCTPYKPPNDFDIYDIFEKRNNCSKHLENIAYCLAGGRDHSICCDKEAKDRDEHVCFGMCKGEGRHESYELWTQYQTCLAINVRSMFQCFLNGYKNSPTPPRHLSVNQINVDSAQLSWLPPAINADIVDNYTIYAYQVDEENNSIDEKSELFFETDDTQINLSLLEPGTIYRVFAVALSGKNKRSLKSAPVNFQTYGIAPRVEAFKSKVAVSIKASSAILACRFRVNGVSKTKLQVKWQHKPKGTQIFYDLLTNEFNQSYFIYSSSKPREHITTLEIKSINTNNFGVYQCIVSDVFGKSLAEVELIFKELQPPSALKLPKTPLECCKTRNVEDRCLPMCGGPPGVDLSLKRYVPRPYMPANCSHEISKVLSCALPEIDDSGCCLRKRVLRQCMYLCDSSLDPSNQMAPVCLDYIEAIEKCRLEGVEKRPDAVQNLRAESIKTSNTASQTFLISWEPSSGAETYYVYWRQNTLNKELIDWFKKSQIYTTFKLSDANEVAVIAANSFGVSQTAQLIYDLKLNKWKRVF